SGGALGKVSIFAMGIGPYITASIIIQLMTAVIPYLENLQKEEGEAGRRKISQITRYFTVVLAIVQSVAVMGFLAHYPGAILTDNHFLFYTGAVVSLTAGSVLVMWLAELITERGLGNGGSLLIFIGILSGIPLYTERTAVLVSNDPSKQLWLLVLLAIFFLAMIMIVVMQEAIRKVIIVNAKRQVGNKVYGGTNTYIPFKLNPGGVMPIIFAMAMLLFPMTILSLLGQNMPGGFLGKVITFLSMDLLNPAKAPYYIIY